MQFFQSKHWKRFLSIFFCVLSYVALAGMVLLFIYAPWIRGSKFSEFFAPLVALLGFVLYGLLGGCSMLLINSFDSKVVKRIIMILCFPAAITIWIISMF